MSTGSYTLYHSLMIDCSEDPTAFKNFFFLLIGLFFPQTNFLWWISQYLNFAYQNHLFLKIQTHQANSDCLHLFKKQILLDPKLTPFCIEWFSCYNWMETLLPPGVLFGLILSRL